MNTLKKTLLCLVAASCAAVGGNAAAEEGTIAPAGEASQTESLADRGKRSEAAEDADFDPGAVKKYLAKAGASEGFDVYLKSGEPEKDIWRAHGFADGKKPSGRTLSDEEKEAKKAAEEEISELKKLGEGALLRSDTGKPAARLREAGKGMLVSERGRFLVEVKEGAAPRVMEVVSTLDSEEIFLTDGGETLVRTSRDKKKIEDTYRYSRTEDGLRFYKSESGEAEARLSEAMDRYYGAYRVAAENDKLRMLFDDEEVVIGLEDKETGYIWWSAPPDSTQDVYATDLLMRQLRSSVVATYGVPEKRNAGNTLRSNTDDCVTTTEDIEGGVRVYYDFASAGFAFPVEYTLGEDYLKACLDVEAIEEKNSANVLTEVTILGGFGAASDKEEGYFVVPDGCGALVRFNNGKSSVYDSYAQKVYGPDVTLVPTTRGAVSEQIYLPVTGEVKDGRALLTVAARGDSNATIAVNCSKQSKTSYNVCDFRFTLRGTDTYYMSGKDKRALTVFEGGDIRSDDIELRYYPISGEEPDFCDIAARYRRYLIEEKGLEKRSEPGRAALCVELYGGTLKKRSILGIPITMQTAVTDYSEARDILQRLSEEGVDDIAAVYKNWTADGIKSKVDTGAAPARVLGGKKEFGKLEDYMEDAGVEFYPVADNRDFFSGNGYYSFTSTAVRVSGNYSRIVSYDRAYGIPDGYRKNMSLLSPRYFDETFGELAKNYSKAGLEGVCPSTLASSLYGDYGKKKVSRYDAMRDLTDACEELDDSLENGVIADCANAYLLPYVGRLKRVPSTSSRFDIFDEDVPFYQAVVHGYIPYSGAAVNGSADTLEAAAKAAAYGSELTFDMVSADAELLRDTEFDYLFYAKAGGWIEEAAECYKLLAPVLREVSDATIEDYEREGDVVRVKYSNGAEVETDLATGAIKAGGRTYSVGDIEREGGR